MSTLEISQLLGNYGEFVGAIAIVVTLIYLAVQIRQNTSALEQSQKVTLAESYQHRSETRRQMSFELAESEYMAPLNVKVEARGWPRNLDVIDELDPVERFRFLHLMSASMIRLDNSCYQYHQGLLDEQAWQISHDRMRIMAPTWKKLGLISSASDRFQIEIEDILANPHSDE